MNFQNIREALIVYGAFTALFLPVRFIFVTYISDSWISSFGLISAVSVLILVLSVKNKLGFFGQIFKRQMSVFHSGKIGKIALCYTAFLLMFFGLSSFSIEMGNSHYSHLKDELITQETQISDYGFVMEQVQEITLEQLLLGILLSFLAFVLEFPKYSAATAIIDEVFDGWLLHFYTVAFVENLEILLMMVFFRNYTKINRISISHNFRFIKKITVLFQNFLKNQKGESYGK